MTITSLTCAFFALALLIFVIGRIKGNPNMSSNLLLALVFGIVVGLGIKSMTTKHTNDCQVKATTDMAYTPIHALPATYSVYVQTTYMCVGQVYMPISDIVLPPTPIICNDYPVFIRGVGTILLDSS